SALSIMRLLPPGGEIASGSVRLTGDNLLDLPEMAMRGVRGGRIAMIFQEPQSSLNPVLTVGDQIAETLSKHRALRGGALRSRIVELLDAVGIPDPERRRGEYPHQLSGGMKQRVMIAIALAGEPDLLIADEPTTALDVTIQAQVLDLLKRLQKETHMAILLITHDLGVVAEMADRVAVMYAGQIVEQAGCREFFRSPHHPYSRKLFNSIPNLHKRGRRLEVISGSVPSLLREFHGCRFENRCDRAWRICRETIPGWFSPPEGGEVRCHLFGSESSHPEPIADGSEVDKTVGVREVESGNLESLLRVDGLKVHFPIRKGILKRVVGQVRAVDGINMEVRA
ncbi:MAG: ATP-binding cassette domain-containing protein, partial [Gammaproteobacteria bacterium]|nr:ATP-binding cassette domain-containing protein [Gammaproteobacteria bacterium]